MLFDEKRAEIWGRKPLAEVFPELRISGPLTDSTEMNWNSISELRTEHALNPIQKLVQKILNCFPVNAFDENGLLKRYES